MTQKSLEITKIPLKQDVVCRDVKQGAELLFQGRVKVETLKVSDLGT